MNKYSDMRGIEWLHPSLASGEIVSIGVLVEDFLKPMSPEEVVAKRQQVNEMITSMTPQPDPKLLAKVDIAEYSAPGLKEEASAPKVNLVAVSPKKRSSKKLPVLFSVHGGALFFMKADQMVFQYISLALELDCVIISPDYRCAPENQYPAAVNDVHAALLWVVDNAKMLGIDPSRIVAEGASSGGHLAAALTHRLKERGGPNLCAQVLEFPCLDDRMAVPSSNIFLENGWIPSMEQGMWRAWLGDKYVRADTPPDAVPGHAKDFHGLPPAIIHSAENDHGRDDAISYASRLLQAGVYCDLHIWGGAYHAFNLAANDTELARRCNDLLNMQMKDALSGKLVRK